MSKRRERFRKFKVYYFRGDYWSSEGEELDFVVIAAESEDDAERIFMRDYKRRGLSLGWIDEL